MSESELKKLCVHCSNEIHPIRLEVLPYTTTCRFCSKEGKKAGKFSFSREGEDVEATLEFYNPEDFKKIQQIEKEYSRPL